ncbi:MAG TPA: methyltransferase domain-containing protein [Chthoniobacterales bacterium]|nr:methyltransferase domain-containing protein [Chthoniobacterales bacterium]
MLDIGGVITINSEPYWLHPAYAELVFALGENANIDYYRAFLPRPCTKITLLELGCGAGGLLLPLCRSGFRGVGVEGNAWLLEKCRTAADRIGVSPRFIHGHITTVDVGRTADAILLDSVIINGGPKSFRSQVLKNISAHLAIGGKAILEVCNPEFFSRSRNLSEVRQDIICDRLMHFENDTVWVGRVVYKVTPTSVVVPMNFFLCSMDDFRSEMALHSLTIIGQSAPLNPATRLICCEKSR